MPEPLGSDLFKKDYSAARFQRLLERLQFRQVASGGWPTFRDESGVAPDRVFEAAALIIDGQPTFHRRLTLARICEARRHAWRQQYRQGRTPLIHSGAPKSTSQESF
ncbi:hypothetical protein [Fodinicurvata sediminis]|uniref:hypothetical protein n=1 Tax=Fodinicurvata sediminis TaxID=1121832 RepID=UPI0003B45418|nr:hypothetical protein [Fodinicurvata sediminis]